MKILVVSPVPTHPTNSGNSTRILRLSETLLGEGHEVHFAHIGFQPKQGDGKSAFWGSRLHEIPYQRPWLKHRVAGIPVPDRWMPILVRGGLATMSLDHHFDRGCLPRLRDLQSRFRFDIVLANYVFFSGVMQAFGEEVLKVLDTHDVFSNRHQLYRKVGLVPEWFYTTEREERRGLMRADRLLAIQEQDRRFFEGLVSGRRDVVEVGHLLQPRLTPSASPSKDLGFFGSDNILNGDSLGWFLKCVWPELKRRVPDVRLQVFGGVSKWAVNVEGVQSHGEVADPGEVYSRVPVMINPMRTGTGLKIKSLEALANGAVLVGSSVALMGLEPAVGSGAYRAESPAEWITVLQRLVRLPEQVAEAQYHALEFARCYYNTQQRSLFDAIRS